MGELESNPEKRIALFQRKEVRRVIHNHEWWFSQAAFGRMPAEYAEFKQLQRENLRDQVKNCSGGHPACRRGSAACCPDKTSAARWQVKFRKTLESPCVRSAGLETRLYGRQDACRYTGNARRELETKSGRKVVTSENYPALAQSGKKAARIKP